MSTGLVICSGCHREVHQGATRSDGARWYHCEDRSAMCRGATAIYPRTRQDIKGNYCGADEPPQNAGGAAAFK